MNNTVPLGPSAEEVDAANVRRQAMRQAVKTAADTFLLFAGSNYYPHGGFKDFKGPFASVQAAIEFVANQHSLDWWHVVDSNNTIVAEGHREY